MNIALIAFDEFTDLDLFLPWDLFNRVPAAAGILDWRVRILGTTDNHVSATGLPVPTSGPIEEAANADAVLFASGSKGILPLLEDHHYLSRLRLDPTHQHIGAMCSGALFLGALGLLRGQTATTYPSQKQRLAAYGVNVVDEHFVANGTVATAAGCLAGVDLSTWVIRSLLGEAAANQVLSSVWPVGLAAPLQHPFVAGQLV